MQNQVPVKSLSATLLLMLMALAIFKLFEVVFVYNVGWRPLPDTEPPLTSAHQPGWEEVAGQADLWLQQTRTELETPVLSAAVSVDGSVVWAGVTGFADLANETAATLNTTFRVGSSSKAVTSIAMGVLIDEGRIDLDAPVSRYLPDVSMPLASISTRQAMSHTGGVREYGICLCFPIWEYYNRKHFDSQRDALRPFETSELLFTPGEDFFYSSYGYNLTGAVIESASASGFSDFLTQQVLTPLSLDNVHVDTGIAVPSDATFYELRDNTYKEVFYVDNTNKVPSGGILATPSAMVQLGNQMITPVLFSEQTRDLLIRHQPLASGQPNPQGYALGWRHTLMKLFNGTVETPVYHHHGVAYGAVSHFSVYPEYGIVVSVIMNRNQATFNDSPSALVEMFISPQAE